MKGLRFEGVGVAIGGTQVLRDLTLAVAPGEIVGLVGASGSGKSMALLAAMGLLPPGATRSGAVLLDGQDLFRASEHALCAVRGARIGMVFQEPMSALNPLQTIGDQVAEAFRLHHAARGREARAAAAQRLAAVGLDPARVGCERYPHQLSGGQRQRVAIAIATALAPAVLLADEPTTALDVTTQAGVLALFARLARHEGMGVILVSHDLAVVAGLADRIALLQDGVVVEEGAAPGMLADLRSPYGRALLAAARPPPLARTATPPGEALPLLEAREATAAYPGAGRARALEAVSLTLRPGENVGLVGESGCGKSTLARALAGLQPLASGVAAVGGEDWARARGAARRALHRRVQIVFQDPAGALNPRWRVEQIVAEPMHLLPDAPTGAARRRRVGELLEQTGLPGAAMDRAPHAFSGGQRQRIAIARALACEPDVLILDEAVSALDVIARQQVLDLLADLIKRRSMASLFISHDIGVVRAVATRVAVMADGRIVEDGPTEAVLSAPTSSAARALVAAAPGLSQALA